MFRSAIVLALVAVIFIMGFVFMPGLKPQSFNLSKDLFIPLFLSLLGAAIYFLVFTRWIEAEFRERMEQDQRSMLVSVASALHVDFMPTDHFTLSNEGDEAFAKKIRKDLDQSDFFYFSGLSARVALVRLFESKTRQVKRVVLKLPLTSQSLERALEILVSIRGKASPAPGQVARSSELLGFDGDHDNLCSLARSQDVSEIREYLASLVDDSVLFAHYVAQQCSANIALFDWEDSPEYRIEMMSCSAFLGNYHPPLQMTEFSSGTCRFDEKTFIWKLLYPSVRSQLEGKQSSKHILCAKQQTPLTEVFAVADDLRKGRKMQVLDEHRVRQRFDDYRKLLEKHKTR